MSIHVIPKVVQGISNGTVNRTCSAGGDYVSATDISGRVVDRLLLGNTYMYAYPYAAFNGPQSTEADAKITLAVKMQHGDSSGGGDMADYSTGEQPTTVTFLTSAMTTPMASWSTGPVLGESYPGLYNLRGAKQYVRCVATPTINFQATATSTADQLHISGGLVFLGAEEEPGVANDGLFSTSTTT